PTYIRGIYLAPWLLSEPIATSVASASVPLRFDPREPAAVDFTVRIGDAFGGQRPSVGAYREYLRANGLPEQGPLRVFAVAQVSVMSMPPGAEHAPGMALPAKAQVTGSRAPRSSPCRFRWRMPTADPAEHRKKGGETCAPLSSASPC